MKYRKKPVVIEAVQWNGSNLADAHALYVELGVVRVPCLNQDCSLMIETLEGTHEARIGDFIIKGIQGELYPCKPDIFAATYEPAN